MIGAIILQCGDSRNGAIAKSFKKHFGWPSGVRVKIIAVAGGAHSYEVDHDFVVRQASIYASVLLSKGATDISLVLTDHVDCGYVKAIGRRQIEKYWTDPDFLAAVWDIAPEIQKVYLTSVSYVDNNVPTVSSSELHLKKVETVRRNNN